MAYTRTVTVADKVLMVRTPDDIVLMRMTGETREFTVADQSDLQVTKTSSGAFQPSSSWLGKMQLEVAEGDEA